MQNDGRRLERKVSQRGVHNTLVGCSLICEQEVIPLEVVNYHYRGACFKIMTGDYRIQNEGTYLRFKIGFNDLPEKINFKLIWETISENGLFGVEFSTESSYVLARSERFIAHKINTPVVSSQDPLDPNRIIYFKVVNISTTGMLLSTSLSNKHLFPGMELRTAILTIPGIGKTDLALFIENSRPSDDDFIFFGVSLKGHSHTYHSLISKYLSNLGATEDSSQRLDKLHEAKLIQKDLRRHLTISEAHTDKEYDAILKLRYEGYKRVGKIGDGKNWRDMGDGLHHEGILLQASLGGQLIASCELRFNKIHGLRISQKIPLSQIAEIRSDNLFEINKLVIHPKAQNSDVVLGLIQKIHSLVMLNGYPDGVIMADDSLVALYQRIGFKRTKISFAHPVKANISLNILILLKESYLESENLNPYAWSIAYEETEKFFRSIGINKNSGFAPTAQINKLISSLLFKISKKIKSQKKERQSNKKQAQAPTGRAVVDPKWTKQHLNVSVILPYLLVAIEMIGDEKIRNILMSFAFDISYFHKSSNWVSVDFFDSFVDKFSEFGNVETLNIKAGYKNISKEILGPNYYIIKHFFSPNIAFKTFEKYIPKLNRTIICKVTESGIDFCRIKINIADPSMISKHKSVVNNWLSFSEAYVQITTGKSARIELLKSVYDGDDCIEYLVRWENPLFSKPKIVGYSFGLVAGAILFASSASHFGFLGTAKGLGIIATVGGIAWFIGKFISLGKKYDQIHDSFTEFEKQADEKYRELQNSKMILETTYQEGKLLETIQKEIQTSDDFSNILNISLQSVCTKFAFRRAFIMLKDEQNQYLRTSSVFGDESSLADIWNFKVDIATKRDNPLVLSSVFHSGQSILINEIQKHKYQLNAASQNLINKLQTKAFSIVPIPSENNNWGVLVADKGESGDIITRRDLVALQRISQSIGLALDKKSKIESEIRIRKIFQKFVPSAVVDQTLGQGELKLGGETKQATCLFLDIRNFTQLSTQIPTAVLVDLLNRIFSLLQIEATKSGGVIDKYLGDGALVTWGAIPGSDANSASAIQCAIEFLKALHILNIEIGKIGMKPVEVGMGIHKGTVIAGNIGSQDRIEFTVIGNTVNLASRLEQLTKVFKCHIVVTEDVADFKVLDKQWTIHKDIQVRGIDSKIDVAAFSMNPINSTSKDKFSA